MYTWVFASNTDQGEVLTCVQAFNFGIGWDIATRILDQAGYRPVKANGKYGFETKWRTTVVAPVGVISSDQFQALKKRGA
jgi:hypothetical protein